MRVVRPLLTRLYFSTWLHIWLVPMLIIRQHAIQFCFDFSYFVQPRFRSLQFLWTVDFLRILAAFRLGSSDVSSALVYGRSSDLQARSNYGFVFTCGGIGLVIPVVLQLMP